MAQATCALEQAGSAERILTRRTSLGFEWGYNWVKFNTVDNGPGAGISSTVTSPATNLNGSLTSLDFSGWYLKVTVAGWMQYPYQQIKKDKAVEKDSKQDEWKNKDWNDPKNWY